MGGRGCWKQWLAVGTAALGLLMSAPAFAADQVVLIYGPLRGSLSVAELATFAETGELSPTLAAYLKMANQDPEEVRRALNNEVKVKPTTLDKALNNPVGDVVLDQVGEVIQTPSGGANRQAMRGALVISASDDDRISLIEVIQNYPTPEVHVRGDRLLEAYETLSRLERGLGGILGDIFN